MLGRERRQQSLKLFFGSNIALKATERDGFIPQCFRVFRDDREHGLRWRQQIISIVDAALNPFSFLVHFYHRCAGKQTNISSIHILNHIFRDSSISIEHFRFIMQSLPKGDLTRAGLVCTPRNHNICTFLFQRQIFPVEIFHPKLFHLGHYHISCHSLSHYARAFTSRRLCQWSDLICPTKRQTQTFREHPLNRSKRF